MPQLIVETGAGLPDANSFISVSYFRDYCGARGYDLAAYTLAEIEAALIRSSQFLTYSVTWKGFRKNGRTDAEGYQGLAWPRYYVTDGEGYETINEVPREVKAATAEATVYELQNPRALQPLHAPNERVSMLRAGDVQVAYDTTRLNAASARPVLLLVADLIRPFVTDGGSVSGRITSRRVAA